MWRWPPVPPPPSSFFTSRAGRRGFVARSAAVFLAAAVIPVLGFFLYFLRVEDWRASLYATAFAWAPLWLTPVAQNPFYLWCTGLDTPVFHLREMAIHFFCVALLVALYARLFQRADGFGSKANHPAGADDSVAGRRRLVQLAQLRRLVAVVELWPPAFCFCRNYKTLSVEREMTFPLLWSVFGLVLLAKLGLFSRVWHYGFALAMPAAITAIFLLFWLLPVLLEKKYNVDPRPFRLAVWLALMIGFGVLVRDSESWYTAKTLAVGQGGDRILAFDPRLESGGRGSATGAGVD